MKSLIRKPLDITPTEIDNIKQIPSKLKNVYEFTTPAGSSILNAVMTKATNDNMPLSMTFAGTAMSNFQDMPGGYNNTTEFNLIAFGTARRMTVIVINYINQNPVKYVRHAFRSTLAATPQWLSEWYQF